jgi:hypothetical protein
LVCLRDPGRIDPKGGGSAACVSESACDGSRVDTCRDEFGRGVVAQGVEFGLDAEPLRQSAVALRDRVGSYRCGAVGCEGEDEGVRSHSCPERAGARVEELAVVS